VPAPRACHRRLMLESLESRALLAGDVQVDVVGGNLKLRGDQECNGVIISQLGEGRYAVVGFEHDGAPTTINGGTEPVIVHGVRGNFDIDLRQGDDLLGIGNDVELLAGLSTDLGLSDAFGAGAELPEVPDQRLRVPRSLIVRTKDGDDGVLVNANIRHSAIIRTSFGSDGVGLANTRVGDNVIVHTETGQDGVLIENTSVGDYLHVNTGENSDTLVISQADVGHALLIAGQGNDAVGISDSQFDRELVLLAAQGNDDVLLTTIAARRIHLDAGSGNDQLGISALAIDDDLTIHTGSGRDSAQVTGSDVDDLLAVFLDTGDDELTISGTSAGKALLRGGRDSDILNIDDLGFAGRVDENEFEDVNEGASQE